MQSVFSWLRSDNKQQAKFVGACILLGAATLWLLYTLVPIVRSQPRAEELSTPGWILARELNQVLLSNPNFADAAFAVDSEPPIRLRLVGGVHTHQDLQDLEARARSLMSAHPDVQYELAVEIMR
ncbi:MAG: hypothetical protein KF745_05650 [Phycisphaeraceae bacterium]|nr:hypothetical protein [Phycisphaeraceae bacterium]